MILRAFSTIFILKVKLQTGGPVKIFTVFSKKSHFGTLQRAKMYYDSSDNLRSWSKPMDMKSQNEPLGQLAHIESIL